MESEYAWKVDFKTLKADAEAKAQPHWQQAEALIMQASQLDNTVKDLRDSIKGSKNEAERKDVEEQIEALKQQAETLRNKAKDEQAAGDRLFWPIYNLDAKNPNAPEAESHDPDVLLAQYKQLLLEIEDTQNQLKTELGAALAHHFADEVDA